MTAQAEVPGPLTGAADADAPVAPGLAPPTRRWARGVAMTVWACALALWWWRIGIPNDSLTVILMLWVGTIAWNVEAPWRRHLEFVRDWALPASVLVFYFFSRGLSDELGLPVHWKMPIDVDRWLGFGVTPTERLQDAWCGNPCDYATEPRWYDVLFTSVYATHFLVGLTLAVVLWHASRTEWVRWMRLYVGMNLGGLVIYILYPMAPPWLASEAGALGHVERLTSRGWRDIGLQRVDVVLHGVGNPVAAMPSLHAGTAVLVAAYAIWRLRSPLRWLIAVYPLLMCVALTYYGEHYVIDLIAGAALAGLVILAVRAYERRYDPPEVKATADDVRV